MKSIRVTLRGTTPTGGPFCKCMCFTVGKYPKSAFNKKNLKQFRSQGKVASIRKTKTGFYVEFSTGHGLPFKSEGVDAKE